jgi:hypothetical protein
MITRFAWVGFVVLVVVTLGSTCARADPCGMVPPVYLGDGPPITRVGVQQTYVFYKDGVETFVIRPGFKGKVDEFGMLIPFPSVPAIRKVPDHIFPHLAAAVDPPEVVIDLRQRFFTADAATGGVREMSKKKGDSLRFNEVRVLRQEAVGMYEVAVLEAGSPAALKKWMDQHKFRYPEGMDKACADYIDEGWCFVAVKTKVGQKKGADPKPGQRKVNVKLPKGSTFDGSVQAMGFRFKSEELVVPMRLSSFNPGELRNIVYLLTDGPRKIRAIPEEYVVRQISGEKLFANVTDPLPLRIIGGTAADIPEWQRKTLPQRRNPAPKNGAAKDLFASDLKAITSGELSLPHEEQEKELLRIGERFGLRGKEIDRLNEQSLADQRAKIAEKALAVVKTMTLTVVDGDFPREVLGKQNLTFAEYKMPAKRNRAEHYDATKKAPGGKKKGVLKLGAIDFDALDGQSPEASRTTEHRLAASQMLWIPLVITLVLGGVLMLRRRSTAAVSPKGQETQRTTKR